MEKITEDEILSINDAVQFNEENIATSDNADILADIDFNTIPEEHIEDISLNPIITERDDLDIGLTLDDFKDLVLYIQGKAQKPKYLDNMTADAEDRLKDIVYVMNFNQLSRIPILVALQNQVQERLFAPENLYSMDVKELTSASSNLAKEIQGTIDSAVQTMQTMNQFGSLNNEYRNLIDMILNLPQDKLDRIKEIVYRED